MKLRNGFVSNSSSASFILTIKDCDVKTFLMNVYEAMEFAQFSFDNYLKEELECMINDLLKMGDKSFYFITKSKQEHIDELNRLRDFILDEEVSIEDKVLEVLKYRGVSLDFSNAPKNIVISNWVTMFNDFSDIHDIIKTLVTYYTFKGKEIDFRIEED